MRAFIAACLCEVHDNGGIDARDCTACHARRRAGFGDAESHSERDVGAVALCGKPETILARTGIVDCVWVKKYSGRVNRTP